MHAALRRSVTVVSKGKPKETDMDAREVIAKVLRTPRRDFELKHNVAVANDHIVADEILSALAAAGFKVLNREPTKKMYEASAAMGIRTDDDVWYARFDAASSEGAREG